MYTIHGRGRPGTGYGKYFRNAGGRLQSLLKRDASGDHQSAGGKRAVHRRVDAADRSQQGQHLPAHERPEGQGGHLRQAGRGSRLLPDCQPEDHPGLPSDAGGSAGTTAGKRAGLFRSGGSCSDAARRNSSGPNGKKIIGGGFERKEVRSGFEQDGGYYARLSTIHLRRYQRSTP